MNARSQCYLSTEAHQFLESAKLRKSHASASGVTNVCIGPYTPVLFLRPCTSALEDALYNFTRPVKTLRLELANPSKQARWQQRTPAMAAGLTDHIWTTQELLHFVLVPVINNT